MTHHTDTAFDIIVTPASPEVVAALKAVFTSRIVAKLSNRRWLRIDDTDAVASAAASAGFGSRLARQLAPRVQAIAAIAPAQRPAMA